MLQFLKKLKLCTKLLPEKFFFFSSTKVFFTTGVSPWPTGSSIRSISGEANYIYDLSEMFWFFSVIAIFDAIFYIFLPFSSCSVANLQIGASITYGTNMRRLPQNNIFGQRDHVIDFIDSSSSGISLITL